MWQHVEIHWWTPVAIALFWVFMLGFGCVYRFPGTSGTWTPEIEQPSPERIAELMQIPPGTTLPKLPRKMRLEVRPAMILEGHPAEAYCYIPRNLENRTMMLTSEAESMFRDLGYSNDPFEFQLLLQPADCGVHEIVCAVQRAEGPPEVLRAKLTVMGGECSEGE